MLPGRLKVRGSHIRCLVGPIMSSNPMSILNMDLAVPHIATGCPRPMEPSGVLRVSIELDASVQMRIGCGPRALSLAQKRVGGWHLVNTR